MGLYNNGMSIAADNAFSLPTGIAPTDVILPSGYVKVHVFDYRIRPI